MNLLNGGGSPRHIYLFIYFVILNLRPINVWRLRNRILPEGFLTPLCFRNLQERQEGYGVPVLITGHYWRTIIFCIFISTILRGIINFSCWLQLTWFGSWIIAVSWSLIRDNVGEYNSQFYQGSAVLMFCLHWSWIF
jgi:hypothetical protein